MCRVRGPATYLSPIKVTATAVISNPDPKLSHDSIHHRVPACSLAAVMSTRIPVLCKVLDPLPTPSTYAKVSEKEGEENRNEIRDRNAMLADWSGRDVRSLGYIELEWVGVRQTRYRGITPRASTGKWNADVATGGVVGMDDNG